MKSTSKRHSETLVRPSKSSFGRGRLYAPQTKILKIGTNDLVYLAGSSFQWIVAQIEYSPKDTPKCLFGLPKSSFGEHKVTRLDEPSFRTDHRLGQMQHDSDPPKSGNGGGEKASPSFESFRPGADRYRCIACRCLDVSKHVHKHQGYENEDRAQAVAGNVQSGRPSGSMIFTAAGLSNLATRSRSPSHRDQHHRLQLF